MHESSDRRIGPYRIVRRLPSGSQGAVYEAEDVRLGRRAAIKTLPAVWADDEDHLARFEREARTLASLSHPNIVTVYGVEEDAEGNTYLAMEWVEGRTLDELMPWRPDDGGDGDGDGGDGQGISGERLLPVALQLAEALEAAHSRGVVHRDLKPANVMLDDDGRLRVLDFGLAKARSPEPTADDAVAPRPLTREGQLVGTLLYMSPEQLRGEEVDGRSDLFSLGAILYELATGGRAFPGEHWGDVAHSVLHADPDPLSEAAPRLPPGLARAILRCLEKDRSRRYRSAAELRHDLDRVRRELESGGLSATSVDHSSVDHASAEDPSADEPVPGSPAAPLPAGVGLLSLGRWGAALRRLPVPARLLLALFLPAAAGGLAWLLAGGGLGDGPGDGPPRVAVLPFANLGPEDEAYFAAGVTEEIRTRLSSVASVRVIAQRSEDLETDAEYRVEGSVRWTPSAATSAGRRVRVTPSLVRQADGEVLWTETYERVLADYFAVQSEIASRVLHELDVALVEPERRALAARPTADMEAYRDYLRGMELAGRRDPTTENWQAAVGAFERAVERDPEFAVAWAELSEVHSLVYHLHIDRSAERLLEARRAAERALAVDPSLPDGRRAMGYYRYWGQEDHDAALAEFEAALAARPGDPQVLAGLAYVQRRGGRLEAAVELFRRALERDPESHWLHGELAHTLRLLRRYSDADVHYRRSIELAPDLPAPYFSRYWNHLLRHGDPAAAAALLDALPRPGSTVSRLARAERAAMERRPLDAVRHLDAVSPEILRSYGVPYPKAYLRGRLLRRAGDPAGAELAFRAALSHVETLRREQPENVGALSVEGLVRAALGQRARGVELARRAGERLPPSRDALVGPLLLENRAAAHALLGEAEEASAILRRLLEMPSDVSVALLAVDPEWDPIRDDPAFAALVEP